MIAPPIVALIEWCAGHFLSAIIGATEEITERFPKKNTFLIRNFPVINELHIPATIPMAARPPDFTYIGTISYDRNIEGMINALERVDYPNVRLRLAGGFSVPEILQHAEALSGWKSVKFEGWLSRDDVAAMLADTRAGLLLIKPIPHEMVSLPIKLFEYMAAGLPVISSDFPRWREIVESADCGILVDPEDEGAIVRAMSWILDNPKEAQEMGVRGREAIFNIYNWDNEAKTLLQLYRFLSPEQSKLRL